MVNFDGDTRYYVLDLRRATDENEASMCAWQPGATTPAHTLPVVAADYGRFLLDTVNEALATDPL